MLIATNNCHHINTIIIWKEYPVLPVLLLNFKISFPFFVTNTTTMYHLLYYHVVPICPYLYFIF